MLRTRILTALALLAAIVPALRAGGVVWALFCLLFVLAAQWEWNRLVLTKRAEHVTANRMTIYVTSGAALALGAIAIMAWLGLFSGEVLHQKNQKMLGTALLISALLWCLVCGRRLRQDIASISPKLWEPVVFLLAAWLALVCLHGLGLLVLFSAMGLVWIADIGAYFAGKAFGRRKLAPVVSPGKSWEGAWGGALALVLLSVIWIVFFPANATISGRLLQQYGWLLALVFLLLICALSVLGDLSESQLKRAAKMKDSSQLLPGHGGVFDRIDALIPSMPLACGLTMVMI
jgi:phosphatidate cytidylyltransferase